ncbi:MAG: hypothetical protein FWC97_12630 [Treponema sp.]|nr:hypothetical protein [Treponema sp.]
MRVKTIAIIVIILLIVVLAADPVMTFFSETLPARATDYIFSGFDTPAW